MNNSYFWTSLFSSTAFFHAGTPIHFAFSASSYVDKQTNKQTNKQKKKKQTNPYAGIHYWITVILQLWKSTLPWGLNWQAIRIKLGPLLEQLSWPPFLIHISPSDSCCVRTIGPMRVDQNTSPTLEKPKGINFQLLPVFKQRMCIYLFLFISIPCKIYISSIIIDNAL